MWSELFLLSTTAVSNESHHQYEHLDNREQSESKEQPRVTSNIRDEAPWGVRISCFPCLQDEGLLEDIYTHQVISISRITNGKPAFNGVASGRAVAAFFDIIIAQHRSDAVQVRVWL